MAAKEEMEAAQGKLETEKEELMAAKEELEAATDPQQKALAQTAYNLAVENVNTARENVNTARENVNTARENVNRAGRAVDITLDALQRAGAGQSLPNSLPLILPSIQFLDSPLSASHSSTQSHPHPAPPLMFISTSLIHSPSPASHTTTLPATPFTQPSILVRISFLRSWSFASSCSVCSSASHYSRLNTLRLTTLRLTTLLSTTTLPASSSASLVMLSPIWPPSAHQLGIPCLPSPRDFRISLLASSSAHAHLHPARCSLCLVSHAMGMLRCVFACCLSLSKVFNLDHPFPSMLWFRTL